MVWVVGKEGAFGAGGRSGRGVGEAAAWMALDMLDFLAFWL